MLKISDKQIAMFRQAARARFEQRVVDHLRTNHARRVAELPDKLLRPLVRGGIARGRAYGLRSDAALITFVALMFVVAPRFDEHPRIQQILRDESVPPDFRLKFLLERTTDEEWRETEESFDSWAGVAGEM